MTTIITRAYADQRTAEAAGHELLENKFQPSMLDVITSGGDAHAEMRAAGVPKAAQEAYANAVGQGNAVLVVRAPFGAAQTARDICVRHNPIDVGVAKPDEYVSTDMSASYSSSILKDHPRFMSSGMYPSLRRGRSMIAMLFGKPLLRKKLKLDTALYRGTKYWANFPLPHLSTKPRKRLRHYIYPGTKYWANFPLPHLTSRDRDPSLY